MKKFLYSILILCVSLRLNSAVLVIEGKYQNKNLYIHNGFGIGGVGFCVKEVKVNGRITTDEINSSSFEIDLKSQSLKYGQNIIIEIVHSDGCMPKVLNMEDLKPKPTFEVIMMSLSPEGVLKWSTKNEAGALPFLIEQFKWNKWIPVGELDGMGTSENHDYSFQVSLHSGENKFRVKQKGFNAFVKVSKDITVVSSINKPSFAIPKNHSSVDFSSETAYEVYDAYGIVVKKGYGSKMDITNLGKGTFYLCYDNIIAEFKK
ncbi:MAG: hypothetical protein PSX36_01055 [bacterium]|nr:hypothetical protein [bacterium]